MVSGSNPATRTKLYYDYFYSNYLFVDVNINITS